MSATISARSLRRCGLLLSGVALAAFSSAGVALAQDDGDGGDEIVITGSRIPRPGFTSTSPIATVGAAELDLQQPIDVEEVLRDMPQFLAGNGAQVNNGSSGASTLDLRGLTTPRTLPLIDGKRMVGFDPNGLFDVTAVPIALLERVDVVTGGASAVYGSDAIAGVVNFILNDDFQGVQLDADYSITDHGDGEIDSYGITLGSSFDDGRGNVALSVGYLNKEPVYQTRGPGAATPGASTTTNPTALDSSSDTYQFDDNGNLVPYFQGFDYNPQNLYQTPQERWTATALGRYQINPSVEAYSRFIFSSSTSAPQLASSGTFGFTFAVPLDNPYLTQQAADFLAADNDVMPCSEAVGLTSWSVSAPDSDCVAVGLRRRTVEVGPRAYSYEYDTFQTLAGLRGSFFGWEWDVAGAHGETSLKRQQKNDLDGNKVQQALFATDTANCFDSANACVPLNLFTPSLGLLPDQADFIRFNLQVQSITTQDYFTSSITGDLGAFKSPLAETPIGVSFGAEYREEESIYEPDAASQSGASPGFGQTLPTRGDYDVTEFFGEALVPLVENASFARELNLELGYRTSDYSTSGTTESYKYGAEWVPVEGLRLRGMFQRAVRAANISELYTPKTPGTGDLKSDPCAGGPAVVAPGSDLYDLCAATGVPTSRLDAGTLPQPTAGQINNFIGGNPALEPEEADTTTFGFVFTPTFAPGLAITVDYYDIDVDNAIAIRPADDVLAGCYSAAGNPTFDPNDADCQLVHRNTLVGNLEGDLIYGVEQLNDNIGFVHAEGIDIGVSYDFDVGAYGTIAVSFDGTHVMSSSYKTGADAATVECVGVYGKLCGLPSTVSGSVGGITPENHWIQRTTWSIGDFDLSYRWRYLSGSEIDASGYDEDGVLLDPDSAKIDDYSYIDLAAAWQVFDQLRVNFAVSNVTDEDAPFVVTETGSTSYNSGNTYPSTYDPLGRVFSVGVSAKF